MPHPLHPVHGHDVGACEFPIEASASIIAVAMRQSGRAARAQWVISDVQYE